MSHYAQVINGIVQQVITTDADFINTLNDKENWIQTSYNTRANIHTGNGVALRGNYAGPGSVYDKIHDVFYSPQPAPNYVLDTTSWTWTNAISTVSNVSNGTNSI